MKNCLSERATSPELLTHAQAAARLNLGVLDVRRLVRTEQCPVVLDSRGRRRIPRSWRDDPAGWLSLRARSVD